MVNKDLLIRARNINFKLQQQFQSKVANTKCYTAVNFQMLNSKSELAETVAKPQTVVSV